MPDAAPNLPSPGATDPAELTPPARRRRRRRTWRRELIELCLIVIVVFVGMRMFLLPYQVDGASMTPYLSNGERLFVNRTAYAHIDLNAVLDLLPGEKHIDTNEFYPFSAPQRGDVIVLTPPTTSKEPYVKRIIGLPGETIAFHEGRVYVNGQPLAESYIDGAITYCYYGRWCSLKVPDDSVYVLG
ncbi:MAG TPA: signal peptidase I, partial [Thermomicrobiales bacterium]|nr:signal peptidase I [Thermomicrobiales bacterium]